MNHSSNPKAAERQREVNEVFVRLGVTLRTKHSPRLEIINFSPPGNAAKVFRSRHNTAVAPQHQFYICKPDAGQSQLEMSILLM